MRIFWFFVLLVISGCSKDSSSTPAADVEDYLLRSQSVKEKILRAYPHLASITDQEQLAIELREIAYFSILDINSGINYFFQPDINIEKVILNQEFGYICGGISITHQQLLAAFGIASRFVGLFTSPYTSSYSHASTEIFVNGKWIISDATFNFFITNQHGQKISTAELHNEVVLNQPIAIVIGPNGSRPDRDINNYFETLENLSAHVVIFPGPFGELTQLLPITWDGSYDFNGNTGTMLYTSGGIYGLINQSYQATQ